LIVNVNSDLRRSTIFATVPDDSWPPDVLFVSDKVALPQEASTDLAFFDAESPLDGLLGAMESEVRDDMGG